MADNIQSSPMYEISSDLRLIVGRIKLDWQGKLQRAIWPGRIGLLIIGGQWEDRYGNPLLFKPGERVNYQLLKGGLLGVIGKGDVTQEVIEFAENPGRLTVTIKRPLLRISPNKSDTASVTLHLDFNLKDPVALISQDPDWREPGGLETFNDRINKRVTDAADNAISRRISDFTVNPSFFSDQDLIDIESDFIGLLDRTFIGWGLVVTSALPPTREYPSVLYDIAYSLGLGWVKLQADLRIDRAKAIAELGLKEYEVRRILALGPAGAFTYYAQNNKDIAIKLMDYSGQLSTNTRQIMSTALISEVEDLDTVLRIVDKLMQQSSSMPFNILGSGTPGTYSGSTPDLFRDMLGGLSDMGDFSKIIGTSPKENFESTFISEQEKQPQYYQEPANSTLERETIQLKDLVLDEVLRIQDQTVKIKPGKIDTVKGVKQSLTISVDERVVYEIRIDNQFLKNGPIFDKVITEGEELDLSQSGVLPRWKPGSHLDLLVNWVRSGHFS